MEEKRRRFARRRRSRGLSQERLAEAVHVDRTTVARWESGKAEPQPWHRRRIARALDVSLEELDALLADTVTAGDHRAAPIDALSRYDGQAADLRQRLSHASTVDQDAIELLTMQADHIRKVDRMLGARSTDDQLGPFLATLEQMRTFTVAANQRYQLAELHSDAAALAGWQSLDQGDLLNAWQHHETAKHAGREAHTPAPLAHALAQQAYVLAELGDVGHAHELAAHARSIAGTAVPVLLSAWLAAVQGELQAVQGIDCRPAFDMAQRLLPDDPHHPELPYIVLDEFHLARWRGSALAKLGNSDAINDLRQAVDGVDSSFTRARAGLHVDLAHALLSGGERAEAAVELIAAKTLAAQVGSHRQRRRISKVESMLRAA